MISDDVWTKLEEIRLERIRFDLFILRCCKSENSIIAVIAAHTTVKLGSFPPIFVSSIKIYFTT